MNETYFAFNEKEKKWVETSCLPVLPVYSFLNPKTNLVYCKTHALWEKIVGIGNVNGKKAVVTDTRCVIQGPFASYSAELPYGYTIKTLGSMGFITLEIVSSASFKGATKKVIRTFTLSAASGEWDCKDRGFNTANDTVKVPLAVSEFAADVIGKYYKMKFGFTPTLTSKLEDIHRLTGYIEYPFNGNYCILKSISGMKKSGITRNDPNGQKKMWEFLKIKPSKILRKKYEEYPFAPILYLFYKQMGFTDANIINDNLTDTTVFSFLYAQWLRVDPEEENTLIANGLDDLKLFLDESFKRNKERTVMKTLLSSIKTYNGRRVWEFFDTLAMIHNNAEILSEEIKNEIFHNGITDHTHNNLVHLLTNIKKSNEWKNEPFNYTQIALSLAWEDKDYGIVFELPTTPNELETFGNAMHNCVGWGNYTNQVLMNKTIIVAVHLKNKPFMCIQVSPKKCVLQALGPCNAHLDKLQRQFLLEWAVRKGVDARYV